MLEAVTSLDRTLFYFLNHSIQNSVFDVLMPFITRTDTLHWRITYAVMWLALVIKGGRTGRTIAVLLIPIILVSDQLSSSVIKSWVGRIRPCHTLSDVRLLVPCGSGLSFPSSHAVNNFAAAILFSFYYRRWTWAFVTFASLVALSRPYVGVHYPADIIGGALLGTIIASLIIALWLQVEKYIRQRRAQRHNAPAE
jgi:undecaprenyl-diphosphatase